MLAIAYAATAPPPCHMFAPPYPSTPPSLPAGAHHAPVCARCLGHRCAMAARAGARLLCTAAGKPARRELMAKADNAAAFLSSSGGAIDLVITCGKAGRSGITR